MAHAAPHFGLHRSQCVAFAARDHFAFSQLVGMRKSWSLSPIVQCDGRFSFCQLPSSSLILETSFK